MGGRCAGVGCKKKNNHQPNHKPFFLLHCIPLLNTFSLHAMPHLMLHHELLGMGDIFVGFGNHRGGFSRVAHPQNICRCTSLLLLSYFC